MIIIILNNKIEATVVFIILRSVGTSLIHSLLDEALLDPSFCWCSFQGQCMLHEELISVMPLDHDDNAL